MKAAKKGSQLRQTPSPSKMEYSKLVIVALVVVAASAAAISAGAKPNEEGGGICGVSQSDLMKCKPAVAAGTATPPPPSVPCCASLKHANLTCFCNFKSSTLLPLLGINATRAIQLPSQCDPTQVAPCS